MRQLTQKTSNFKLWLIGIFILGINLQVYAQEHEITPNSTASNNPSDQKEQPTWGITPLIVPIYTPETRWMIAGGGMFWHNPWPEAKTKRLNEIMTFFSASQNEQYGFGLFAEAYFDQHRLKLMQKTELGKEPNFFWGIGPESPDRNKEKFEPKNFTNRTSVLWLFGDNLYIGPMWRTRYSEIRLFRQDKTLGRQSVPGYTPPAQGKVGQLAVVNGPGIHLVYDSRVNPFYPIGGQWFETRLAYSEPSLAARGRFTQLTIDWRRYYSVWLEHVVAVNAFLVTTAGDAPWQALPHFGGQFQMRGFFYGRYIDRHMWVAQADYRLPAWWRFGLVVFAGVGDVTGDLLDPVSSEFKAAAGLGLRILVDKDEHVNMRIDLGFSTTGETNFYFTFKEAF